MTAAAVLALVASEVAGPLERENRQLRDAVLRGSLERIRLRKALALANKDNDHLRSDLAKGEAALEIAREQRDKAQVEREHWEGGCRAHAADSLERFAAMERALWWARRWKAAARKRKGATRRLQLEGGQG